MLPVDGRCLMKNYARKQFSCDEIEQIKAAVAAVEKETSGEILPVVRSCSSRYRLPVMKWVLVCQICFVTVWGVVSAVCHSSVGEFDLPIFAAVYLVLTFFLLLLPDLCPPFLRLLAGSREMNEAVTSCAVHSFVRYGVSGTVNRSGILIFISLFERQVLILADKGINEKVDPDTWKAVSDRIAAEMKAGRPAEAVIGAVASCRTLLASHFPPSEDNPDELPDFIME